MFFKRIFYLYLLVAFCTFACLRFCAFGAFGALLRTKFFRKKVIKGLKLP